VRDIRKSSREMGVATPSWLDADCIHVPSESETEDFEGSHEQGFAELPPLNFPEEGRL
jgi:hypothetical protein